MKRTLFKETPFFYLHKEDIIKQYKNLRFGKMKGFNFYFVEDEYSITRYKTKQQAEKHFNLDVNIDKKIDEYYKCDKKQKKVLK
jgi:hypothetical protein